MDGKLQYVVASDYAARGMHFDDVDVIINISLPEESTEYVHRAGRCGRNGKNGMCISIITDGETNKIKKFQKDLAINMVERSLYQGKLVAKNKKLSRLYKAVPNTRHQYLIKNKKCRI